MQHVIIVLFHAAVAWPSFHTSERLPVAHISHASFAKKRSRLLWSHYVWLINDKPAIKSTLTHWSYMQFLAYILVPNNLTYDNCSTWMFSKPYLYCIADSCPYAPQTKVLTIWEFFAEPLGDASSGNGQRWVHADVAGKLTLHVYIILGGLLSV